MSRGRSTSLARGAAQRKRDADIVRVDDRELDAPWYTMLREDIDRQDIDDAFERWPEMDRK